MAANRVGPDTEQRQGVGVVPERAAIRAGWYHVLEIYFFTVHMDISNGHEGKNQWTNYDSSVLTATSTSHLSQHRVSIL